MTCLPSRHGKAIFYTEKEVTAQRQLARSTVEFPTPRNFDVYSPASGKLKHARTVVQLQAHSHE